MLETIHNFCKTVGSVIVVIGCVVSLIMSYGRLNWKIADITNKLDSHCMAAEAKYNEVSTNKEVIIGLKKDIQYLAKNITSIGKSSEYNREILYKILDKVK